MRKDDSEDIDSEGSSKQRHSAPTVPIEIIEGKGGIPIYFSGPGANEGPLPSFFYFALSGEESLRLHPFNHPAASLQGSRIRVFSLTLPAHGPGHNSGLGVNFWRDELLRGNDVISDFIRMVFSQIDLLTEKGLLVDGRIAAGGLSRGAFIATHLAAFDPRVTFVLGYAPLTKLSYLRELSELKEDSLIKALDLEHHLQALVGKVIRYYIGNHDTRVGTRECFEVIEGIVEASIAQRNRSPRVEMHIYPSVGHRGHGTPSHIFEEGAGWIKHHLLS